MNELQAAAEYVIGCHQSDDDNLPNALDMLIVALEASQVEPEPVIRYEKFQAMAQGKVDYTLPVFPIGKENDEFGTMMVIGADEGAIYITREQAMKFFGLYESPQTVNLSDKKLAELWTSSKSLRVFTDKLQAKLIGKNGI